MGQRSDFQIKDKDIRQHVICDRIIVVTELTRTSLQAGKAASRIHWHERLKGDLIPHQRELPTDCQGVI